MVHAATYVGRRLCAGAVAVLGLWLPWRVANLGIEPSRVLLAAVMLGVALTALRQLFRSRTTETVALSLGLFVIAVTNLPVAYLAVPVALLTLVTAVVVRYDASATPPGVPTGS